MNLVFLAVQVIGLTNFCVAVLPDLMQKLLIAIILFCRCSRMIVLDSSRVFVLLVIFWIWNSLQRRYLVDVAVIFLFNVAHRHSHLLKKYTDILGFRSKYGVQAHTPLREKAERCYTENQKIFYMPSQWKRNYMYPKPWCYYLRFFN